MGNLRTAWLAWRLARESGRQFFLRIEDVDTGRSRPEYARHQIADLQALGIDWDGPVLSQSTRFGAYRQALADLAARGLAYECYCSRADIRAAASAPHGPVAGYTGTCRELSDTQRAEARARLAATGRAPAWRLKAPLVGGSSAGGAGSGNGSGTLGREVKEITVTDGRLGPITGPVQDVVLRRSDGDWAYNLAVVVDDIYQGVDQVVRGEDLAEVSPTQAFLFEVLGAQVPTFVHVPLWLGPTGQRLAKRDGAVTRAELNAQGVSDKQILEKIRQSLKDHPWKTWL